MPRARRPNPANNRTDLMTPQGPSRVATAPGQEYGKQTAQQQSQQILPIGLPTTPAPPAAPSGGPPQPSEAPAPAGPLPGQIPWIAPGRALTHGEPITTGMPNSPGPGPEILGAIGRQAYAARVSEHGNLQSVLEALASQPGSSSIVKSLAQTAGLPRR